MKRFAMLSLLGAFLFTSTAFSPYSSTNEDFFGVVLNQRLPFDALIDFCGEDVYTVGEFHVIITQTVSGNGNFHTKFHINAKGKGVGLDSGARYEWNDAINETLNLTQGGNGCCGNLTSNQQWRVIGKGRAPNFLLDSQFHITVNANGEFAVVFDRFSVECK